MEYNKGISDCSFFVVPNIYKFELFFVSEFIHIVTVVQ
jgi:hypothetical protein